MHPNVNQQEPHNTFVTEIFTQQMEASRHLENFPAKLSARSQAHRVSHIQLDYPEPDQSRNPLSNVPPQPDGEAQINHFQSGQLLSVGGYGKTSRQPPTQPLHRSAQLESFESEFDRDHRLVAFERRMRHVSQLVAGRYDAQPAPSHRVQKSPQTRQLGESAPSPVQSDHAEELRQIDGPRVQDHLPVRRRKRLAKRLDVDARQYRQPSEELPADTENVVLPAQEEQESGAQLQGLGPYGTRYPIDFDVKPLALGSYFHQSTFIGSGEFADSLHLGIRDLDRSTGARMSIRIGAENVVWSNWNEDVSDGMNHVPQAIRSIFEESSTALSGSQVDEVASLAEQNIHYLLRSVIRYMSKCLVFLDAVDRQACIIRELSMVNAICEVLHDVKIARNEFFGLRLHCFTYLLVLANQAASIGNHPLVQSDTRAQSLKAVQDTGRCLLNELLMHHMGHLRTFYEENRIMSKRDGGILSNHASVAALVALYHVINDEKGDKAGFWSLLHHSWPVNAETMTDVRLVDHVWYDVLTLLPALEINDLGVVQVGTRLQGYDGDWAFMKQIVRRVLELYAESSKVSGSTVNEYLRACLVRCYVLATHWGWYKCEPILYLAFDFFGRRGLGLLHKEEGSGSPNFLDNLNENPSFDIQQTDSSFAIFLKILVASVQAMQKRNVYDERKIGSIVWRLIPNHGRTYPREKEVRQDDLDALRNHHDLLCCLYFAAPPSRRPPLNLLRNLVDHHTSHREACRINVRAWARLAAFQTSTQEPEDSLQSFIDWYLDMLRVTIQQYRLARNEAETQFAIAKAQGVSNVTETLLESTVASNQRQIAASIVDALAALKRALTASNSLNIAGHLLSGSAFWQAFDLFDPSQRRTHSIALEGLSVARSALDMQIRASQHQQSQNSSEESQDYGDTSALEDLVFDEQRHPPSALDVADTLVEPIWRLMSNVFGADADSEDTVLLQVIDLWVALAEIQVQRGKTTWDSYVNSYSTTSWSQLRDTAQTRRYLPYFLARVTQCAKSNLSELRWYLVTSWLRSLVEREAKLKFQQVLTASLLEHCADDELLFNLPFVQSRTGAYHISLQDIRLRRLALLSSIFRNMRDSLDGAVQRRMDVADIRRRYADILRQLTLAMKANYQDLQVSGGDQVASATAQGAYVDFVQNVVAFLQQYTSDISAVDRFFTDSTAFPLPATDPTYVVGRLRSYASKLSDAKARKQLAMFVQTVSERAAVDQQQKYLVDQLQTAVAGVAERGNQHMPSLRQVLITSIFPVYVELAISNTCAWIIAGPILQACGNIIGDLLLSVDPRDGQSWQTVGELALQILQASIQPIHLAMAHVGLLKLPHALRMLANIYSAVQNSLSLMEYLIRITQDGAGVWKHSLASLVCHIHMLGERLQAYFSHTHSDALLAYDLPAVTMQPIGFKDTLQFTRQQAKQSLGQEWFAQEGGRYFVRRGFTSNNNDSNSSNREVFVDLQDEDVEREGLLLALRRFSSAYAAIFDHNGCGQESTLEVGGVIELMRDVVI